MKFATNKKYIFGLFTGIVLSTTSVLAATEFLANNVSYTTSKDKNVKTVEDALNSLYNSCETGNTLNDELLNSSDYSLSLEDVLTSSSGMKKILSNSNSIDIIVNDYDKYGKIIVNSKSSMESVINNSKIFNKILMNSKWTSGMLKSNISIESLDSSNPVVVPTMKSNTSPSGETFASSAYSGCNAYKAFDNDDADYWAVAEGLSYKDQYIGYDFVTPIWVYKVEIKFIKGKQDTDFVIEASNNRNDNWTIIKSGLHESSEKQTIIMNNYNQKYRYYRVRLLSNIPQSGSGNTVIQRLQFYGK